MARIYTIGVRFVPTYLTCTLTLTLPSTALVSPFPFSGSIPLSRSYFVSFISLFLPCLRPNTFAFVTLFFFFYFLFSDIFHFCLYDVHTAKNIFNLNSALGKLEIE